MSLKVVDLGIIRLTDSTDGLELTMTTTADFRLPYSISALGGDGLIQALTQGKLWATRAAACRLDIEVRINGKKLDSEYRLHLLESLGYGIRDSEIWNLLSLYTSLELSPKLSRSEHDPDISICLQNSSPGTNDKASRASVLERVDVNPPDSVLCARFEGLRMQLDFSIPSRASKRSKYAPDGTEMMLLDCLEHKQQDNFAELEGVVSGMQQLSSSIANCFDAPSLPSITALSPTPGPLDHVASTPSTSKRPAQVNASVVCKGRLAPTWITDMIEEWIEQHGRGRKLKGEERLSMLQKTGLTSGHLSNLMTRLRRKKSTANNNEILLEEGGNRKAYYFDHNEMLLSPTTESTPSLISTPSTIASPRSSIMSKRTLSLGDTVDTNTFRSSNVPSASGLSDVALHVLMAGWVGPTHRALQGLRIKRPPPDVFMASLVPTMFNPGFIRSVSHNARFLPTVSHAISDSWPRNVQSPTLRRKLSQLSNQTPSTLTHNIFAGGTSGSVGRLASVIQSRLWTAMQTNLYDAGASKKLWDSSKIKDPNEGEDSEASQIKAGEERRSQSDMSMLLAEDEDFYDLFDGSDDEDMLDEAEQERLAVEKETDEMLLGEDWENLHHDEDALLLDAGSDNGSMLL